MGFKIVFSEVKEKVGIDDVAYSLGYTINLKAGVKNYLELNLGPVSNPVDTIIVRNIQSKGKQTFFRRNGQKGDVITLIKENLYQFNVPGNDEWTKVANVLANFAKMPYVYDDTRELARQKSKEANAHFDPDRYRSIPVNPDNLHWILTKRGFSNETVKDMKDFICLVRDTQVSNFNGYNVGFPYHKLLKTGEEKLAGYEIRGGNGFKSKAAGMDSSHSFWHAEFPKDNPYAIRNVYLFESGFDAMAFYQANKKKIDHTPFALVSMGGSFTEGQVHSIMDRYPSATLIDCFDNDLAGNIYSVNLVRYAEKKDIKIDYKGMDANKEIILSYNGRKFSCKAGEFRFTKAASELNLNHKSKHMKPPDNFKDWNDFLLGEGKKMILGPKKYELERNLAKRRKGVSM